MLPPCDQGIIQNLTFYYKEPLLRKHLTAIEAKQDVGVNILDACHLLLATWSPVTSATIKKLLFALRFVLPQSLNLLKKTKWRQHLVRRSTVYQNH
jgi:hypothetical protein